VEQGPGPEYTLAKEEPLCASGELVLELYKVRPELEDAYWTANTVYSYWISEASNRSNRAYLRRSRYDELPFHASDDLRFLLAECEIMAGNGGVVVWRRVKGPRYRYLAVGTGRDEAFDYYVREWKAEHAGPEAKGLRPPESGMHVWVSFIRWTKPNREILLSLHSDHGGASGKEIIDDWYFLCDLETLRLSRDLTGVALPPREDEGNDGAKEPE
jgi:hypothetical protein